MASADEERPAFERLMARAGDRPEPAWSAPGDLGRASIEAMIEAVGDLRAERSRGSVRLTGAGVRGHAADLEAVGRIATNWQRVITAVGAAIEGSKSAFGRVSANVEFRTRLSLEAAPAPGSIILNLTPASEALQETAPGGERKLFDSTRPLADRATETLLALLAETEQGDINSTDELAIKLRELGPRVGSALKRFSDTARSEHFDVEFEWMEPAEPTRRARLSAGTAGWLSEFVSGRDLDATEAELAGTVRTVSDLAKWVVETSDGMRQVDAQDLGSQFIRDTNVGDEIRLLVLIRTTERPDGTTISVTKALRPLSSLEDEDAPPF